MLLFLFFLSNPFLLSEPLKKRQFKQKADLQMQLTTISQVKQKKKQ